VASSAIAVAGSADIPFNSATVSPSISGASFNTGTYSYTVGVTGDYSISITAYFSGSAAVPGMSLRVDGVKTDYGVFGTNSNLGTNDTHLARSLISVVKHLTAGQVLKVTVYNGNTVNTLTVNVGGSFSIIKY
jgi:hypothetical protein